MKRILLFVALLIFVVGVCNSAGIDESPLYGTYMNRRSMAHTCGPWSILTVIILSIFFTCSRITLPIGSRAGCQMAK